MSKYYKIEGEKLERAFKSCPKCGQGFFMAKHQDRESCGRCGYTEMENKGKKRRGR